MSMVVGNLRRNLLDCMWSLHQVLVSAYAYIPNLFDQIRLYMFI